MPPMQLPTPLELPEKAFTPLPHDSHDQPYPSSSANTLCDFDFNQATSTSSPSTPDGIAFASKKFESTPMGTLTEDKVVEDLTVPLARQTTVECGGLIYPTRSGRGEAVGEPLTHITTNERITYIDFPDGDPENPFNWSFRRKYSITVTAIFITTMTAVNATGYSLAYESASKELGVSHIGWTIGNTLYLVAISFTPLFLAPLSEVIGRNKIYLITGFLNVVLGLPQALAHNMTSIYAARWFQGMCSSVGNSMVGGTIADLFYAEERGKAMSLYALFVYAGQGVGPLIAGWVAQYAGWRWVFWITFILFGVSFLGAVFILKETRGSIILSRRAARLTKETGRLHAAPGDTERADLRTLITHSISRPIIYLFTEPIVAAISIWVGFVWGVVFLFVNTVGTVYGQAYGFGVGASGSVVSAIAVAGLVGMCIDSVFQNRAYARARKASPNGRAEPEARLIFASIGAFVFPICIIWFAWTAQASVPWPVSVIALGCAYLGTFCIYSGVFNYLADAYERYSSSAQAAQSMLRNLLAGVLPLAGPTMYEKLTPQYASTLLGCLGLVLGVCPVIILFFGKRLRARSKVASALLQESLEFEAERLRKKAEGEASRRGSTSHLPQQQEAGKIV